MTVRSRIIVITVPTDNTIYYFKIRGINSISFALDMKVGTAQGIAANFVHPWFIGPVDIKLSGSTYIGTFYNVQDELINETEKKSLDPVKAKSFKEVFTSIGKGITEATIGRFKKFKKPVLPEEKKGIRYPKTYQFLMFTKTLYEISETIRTGYIKKSNNTSGIIKQKLEIYDYLGPKKNLVFNGFISDISITEEQSKLGIIKFTISFKGILEPIPVKTNILFDAIKSEKTV